MKTKIFALLVLATFIVCACKETKKEEKQETIKALPQDQLRAKIMQFQDSAKAVWAEMMQADDQKITFTKRLLDEVPYTPKYDIVKHAKLVTKCKSLKEKRFDEKSFFISANIDKYDAATDSLLKEVKALVLATPNVENYPLCSELLNDITALDNDVIMHRVKYDGWAQDFNQILVEHHDELAKMGAPYSNLQKMGLFQLEQ